MVKKRVSIFQALMRDWVSYTHRSFSRYIRFTPRNLDVVPEVEKQPLVAATQRLVTAMETAGSPFDEKTIKALEQAYRFEGNKSGTAIQKILDSFCHRRR